MESSSEQQVARSGRRHWPEPTSIGQLFWLEMSLMKLCAGFTLSERLHWSLNLIYRLGVLAVTSMLCHKWYAIYNNVPFASKPAKQNIGLFNNLAFLAIMCRLVNGLVSGLRPQRLTVILLQKKLDGRYLMRSAASEQVNRIAHPKGSALDWPAATHGDGSQMGGVSQEEGGAGKGGGSKVRLARVLLICFLLHCAIASTMRIVYNQQAPPDANWSQGAPLAASANSTSRALGPLAQAARKTIRLVPVFALELLCATLIAAQVYGPVLVTLFITVTLSDMLRRARQLNESADHQPVATTTTTTYLLIQTRDALVALRSAMSLNFLSIQLMDVSLQMAVFSVFTSVIFTNQWHWFAMLSLEYSRLLYGSILARLGYFWLHNEARQISFSNERRLIDTTLNIELEVSDCARSSSSSISATSYSVPSAGSSPLKQARARVAAAQLAAQRLARVAAATNARLANEIEQLWPSDWYTPDMVSFVGQCFFVVTFVATLQQLVETGAKMEFQSKQAGRQVERFMNSTSF